MLATHTGSWRQGEHTGSLWSRVPLAQWLLLWGLPLTNGLALSSLGPHLASNERIPLNRTMRLVFEISHLRTATPATVSRAGILYINPADLGWNP